MAGLKGNVAWWAWGKQSAKGTAATQAKYQVPFTGGNIGPVRETAALAETDSSRDVGLSYVARGGVEGTPETYLRDANFHSLVECALGTSTPSGTTNYTHVGVPATVIPYVTVWKNLGDTLWEQYTDCMVNELTVRAEAGSPATVGVGFVGRTATRLTSTPTTGWTTPAVTLATGAVYNYNEAAVTLAGGANALIRSYELTVSNNIQAQQTDDVIPYDVTPGQRTVSLSFDLIFEDLVEYNKFHFGSSSGTAVSSAIYTTALDVLFTKGANNSVDFNVPVLAYEEFSPEPNVGGDAVVVSVRAVAQRPNPVLTITTKNQAATT